MNFKSSMILSTLMLMVASPSVFAIKKEFPDINKKYESGQSTGWPKAARYDRQVVLTFDDGPDPVLTPKVLDVLKKYNAKATFFILGKNVSSKTTHIIERMLKEGHLVASHGTEHHNSNTITEAVYKQNLKSSVNTLEDVMDSLGYDQKEMYYRFPYGAFGRGKQYHHLNTMKQVSQEVYGENCINYAFWDIDTEDWVADMTPQKIAQNIIAYVDGGTYYEHYKDGATWRTRGKQMSNPPGGGIALLHDVKDKDIQAVEIFLKYAQNNSIEVIPLSQVEGYRYDGKSCERLRK